MREPNTLLAAPGGGLHLAPPVEERTATMTDGTHAEAVDRRGEESRPSAASNDSAAARTKFEFLYDNIADIKVLREAAENGPLRAEEIPDLPTFHRGAVGVAVMDAKLGLLNSQLPRWATYFSKNIDNLLRAYELLESEEPADPQAVNYAYEASSNILGALERTLTVRLAS